MSPVDKIVNRRKNLIPDCNRRADCKGKIFKSVSFETVEKIWAFLMLFESRLKGL